MNADDLFDADEYLHFLGQALVDEDTAGQVAFIEKALAMAPPMRVLDLGCGHGRHANAFGRLGYEVLGVDLVEGFLAIARREAIDQLLRVKYLRADMADLPAGETFDRAINIFDAFGYLDDAHAARTLAAVHRALVPGGKLLLDLRAREWMSRVRPTAVLDLPNGDFMLDRFRFDVATGRFHNHRTYLRGDKRHDIQFSVRVWTLTEITTVLAGAGFDVTAVYGGFDGSELTADRMRMILVCAKR